MEFPYYRPASFGQNFGEISWICITDLHIIIAERKESLSVTLGRRIKSNGKKFGK